MSKKKKYYFYHCEDCEKDFLTPPVTRYRIHCPLCGEYFYTKKVMQVWVERPFQYKRPWTPDEDELIVVGRSNGYTHQRISESLDGRTMKAVARRWAELKKKGKNHDQISSI